MGVIINEIEKPCSRGGGNRVLRRWGPCRHLPDKRIEGGLRSWGFAGSCTLSERVTPSKEAPDYEM